MALLMVLVSHGFFFTGRTAGIGRIGVNLFFFISGLLVHRSLMSRSVGSGFVGATRFWRRRLLRLYPALIAYVFTMLVVTAVFQFLPDLPDGSDPDSYLRNMPYALLYLINYYLGPLSLSHLWSVSCEMQFYLLAPVFFLIGKSNHSRTAQMAVAVVVLSGLGFAYPILHRGQILSAKYHFEFAVWPMAFGLFCEHVKASLWRVGPSFAKVSVAVGSVFFAGAIALMLLGFEQKLVIIGLGAFLLIPCFFSYLFGLAVPGVAGNGLVWIGQRTYSIYLWQQPLTLCGFLPPILHPWGAIGSVAVGSLWFRLFELPVMSSGRKMTSLERA